MIAICDEKGQMGVVNRDRGGGGGHRVFVSWLFISLSLPVRSLTPFPQESGKWYFQKGKYHLCKLDKLKVCLLFLPFFIIFQG